MLGPKVSKTQVSYVRLGEGGGASDGLPTFDAESRTVSNPNSLYVEGEWGVPSFADKKYAVPRCSARTQYGARTLCVRGTIIIYVTLSKFDAFIAVIAIHLAAMFNK